MNNRVFLSCTDVTNSYRILELNTNSGEIKTVIPVLSVSGIHLSLFGDFLCILTSTNKIQVSY